MVANEVLSVVDLQPWMTITLHHLIASKPRTDLGAIRVASERVVIEDHCAFKVKLLVHTEVAQDPGCIGWDLDANIGLAG